MLTGIEIPWNTDCVSPGWWVSVGRKTLVERVLRTQ